MMENLITVFLFLLTLIYLYCTQSSLPFGTIQNPLSGFFPLIVGIFTLIVNSLLLSAKIFAKTKTLFTPIDWTKFIFIIIGVIFYVTIFDFLGYFLSTFILLFYLFKIIDSNTGLLRSFTLSSSSSIFFYFFIKKFF